MDKDILEIKFDTRKYPGAQFDLLRLEEMLARTDLDHNPGEIHRVNFFLIILVTSGESTHTIDFTEYPLRKGTVLTIRKDQIIKFGQGSAQGFLILFTDNFIIRYLEQLEVTKAVQLFNETLGKPCIQLSEAELPDIVRLVEDLRQEFQGSKDNYTPGIIRSLLQVLIIKLYRAKANKDQIIHSRKYLEEFIQFQRLVEQQCFQTKRVADYAQQMGVTPKTLNNIVRHIVQKSAKTFIDEMVILQIKRLLINSSHSIKEIAYHAGFKEPSNMFKYFKKFTGSTPETFRKAH